MPLQICLVSTQVDDKHCFKKQNTQKCKISKILELIGYKLKPKL